MIESPAPKPGSGRAPATQRRSGPTAWPRPRHGGKARKAFSTRGRHGYRAGS